MESSYIESIARYTPVIICHRGINVDELIGNLLMAQDKDRNMNDVGLEGHSVIAMSYPIIQE